ncbi:MAG: MBL fold metallo-hydrolase [Thiotrichales bacterium]
MALRCRSLGSGSRGNATLVETDESLVLVDCGFSAAEVERRIASAGYRVDDLDAILVTHEHGDHVRGADTLSRRYEIPVWLTPGCKLAMGSAEFHAPTLISSHAEFCVKDLRIQPFPVPHDAREPCQFVFSNGTQQLGLLTDLGCVTPHILAVLRDCTGLLLEFNYERPLLMAGSYPESLKHRIDGAWGHLSNRQACELLVQLDRSRLRFVVGMHLSEQNNTPERVRTLLSQAVSGHDIETEIADQHSGCRWFELDG